jgi:hypothetical protein
MRCFHRTPEADAILAGRFRDSEGTYGTTCSHRGVWVSDTPPAEDALAADESILVVKVPEAVFMYYWWVQAESACHEALIPASILNRYPVSLWTRDEDEKTKQLSFTGL